MNKIIAMAYKEDVTRKHNFLKSSRIVEYRRANGNTVLYDSGTASRWYIPRGVTKEKIEQIKNDIEFYSLCPEAAIANSIVKRYNIKMSC